MISLSLGLIEALSESLIWYWWWEQPWQRRWGLCLWLDRTFTHRQGLEINRSSPLKLEGGPLVICLEVTKDGWMDDSWAKDQSLLLERQRWPCGIWALPEQTRARRRALPSNQWNQNISVRWKTATGEAIGRACVCAVLIASCGVFCLWCCWSFKLSVWDCRGEVKSCPFTW